MIFINVHFLMVISHDSYEYFINKMLLTKVKIQDLHSSCKNNGSRSNEN